MNAKELKEVGACHIISEDEFSSETLLKEIDNLLFNEDNYKKMALASSKLGIKDSATKIYNVIKELI